MADRKQSIQYASVMLDDTTLANTDTLHMAATIMTTDDTNRRVSRELQSVHLMAPDDTNRRVSRELQSVHLMAPDDTNRRVSRELQSVKPYKTKDEYLYAMKEDLSEWLNSLYDLDMTAENFFEQLDTGVILCRHAQMTRKYIMTSPGDNCRESRSTNHNQLQSEQASLVTYTPNAKPCTFQCRDNISNFIHWCRHSLHVPETLLFETDDLVLRKNERNVILCILETARRGVKFGMPAPLLVQLEQEIEEEIIADKISAQQTHEGQIPTQCNESPAKKNKTNELKGKPVIHVDMMSLDEMVREILSRCTCPNQFPMIRLSEGRYRIGDSLSQIFIRILRNHVMVRIGGGWDTLENYLDRHDPCQCQNKGHHRGSSAQRRPSRSSLVTSSVLSVSSSQSERSSSSDPANTSVIQQTTESVTPTKQSPLNTPVPERKRSTSRASNTNTRTPAGAQLNAMEIKSKLRRSSTLPASSVKPLTPGQLSVSTVYTAELNPNAEILSNDSDTVSNHYTHKASINSPIVLRSPISPSTPSSSNESLIGNALSRRGSINSPSASRQGSEFAVNITQRSLSNFRPSLHGGNSNTTQLSQTSLGHSLSNTNSASIGSSQINARNIRRTASTSDVTDGSAPDDLQKESAKMKALERKQISDQQRQFNLSLLTRKSPRGRSREPNKTKERVRSVGPIELENKTESRSMIAEFSQQNRNSICDSEISFVSKGSKELNQPQARTVISKAPVPRARSVGPQEMGKGFSSRSINSRISSPNGKSGSDNDVLMITRDGTGKHQLEQYTTAQRTSSRSNRNSLLQLHDESQQEKPFDVSPLNFRNAQTENRSVQTEQIRRGSTVQRSRSALTSDNARKSRIGRCGLPSNQILPNKQRTIIYSSSSDNSLEDGENYENNLDRGISHVDNAENQPNTNGDENGMTRTDLLFEEYRRVGEELLGLINNANDCDDLFKCPQDNSTNTFNNSYNNETDNCHQTFLPSKVTSVATDQTASKQKSNPCMIVNPMENVRKDRTYVVNDSISNTNYSSMTNNLDIGGGVEGNSDCGLHTNSLSTSFVGVSTDGVNSGNATKFDAIINGSINNCEDVTMKAPDSSMLSANGDEDVLHKTELLWFSSHNSNICGSPNAHTFIERAKLRKDEKYNSASKIPKPICATKTTKS